MLSHFFLRRFIIFYTNVDRYGNQILFRGYNNKTQITKKVKFEPTFYIPSPKGAWKTLDGRTVDSVQPGSMRDCKEFMDKYADVDNFTVYGTTNYVHQFISDAFPKTIKYDRNQINICTIDIEVASEDGFPEPRDAKHEIITITIKNNNGTIYHTWGLYDFNPEKSGMPVLYRKCKNERELLLG